MRAIVSLKRDIDRQRDLGMTIGKEYELAQSLIGEVEQLAEIVADYRLEYVAGICDQIRQGHYKSAVSAVQFEKGVKSREV